MYSPDRCWSNSTPRYLTVDLADNILPPQVTLSWVDVHWSFFLVPNRMDSVLPKWRESLLSVSQLLIDFSSLVSCNSISLTSFPGTIRAESSAYSNSLQLTAEHMSLTYTRNKSGPRIDPWGTPQVTFWKGDKVPPISTGCLRFVKYEWNHSLEHVSKPKAWSLLIRMQWSTVSNAFWRSNSTMPVKLPLSLCNLM